MTSNIIDGKLIAENLRVSVKEAVSTLPSSPTLAVVLVGDDPASQVYVRSKIKFTKECGMISLERRLPSNASQEDVIQTVRALNQDESVDGILVQLRRNRPLKGCGWVNRNVGWTFIFGENRPSPVHADGLRYLGKIGARRPDGKTLCHLRAIYSCGETCRSFILRTKLYRHDCAFTDREYSWRLPQRGYPCTGCRATGNGVCGLDQSWGRRDRCRYKPRSEQEKTWKT